MRIIKKIIRKLYHLIWFLSVFLIFTPSVFAIPTGEIYSETTSSNITLLSKFQYADGEVSLYGRSGSGQTSPFIPSLNEFRDGNYSLFTYQSIPGGNRTSFGMNFYLDKTLMSGKSYTSTFKVAGNPGTVDYYFSNPYSVTNANLNSKSITCLTGSCFINTTFTMSSSTNELHIDFSPTEGLNGQIFVDIFTGIFMAQVEEYNYLDTSGLQNNQQIIINQNDQIINNNNQNTQDIINSSGSNTQSIIDNQNENSNKEIESQKVCKDINFDNSVEKSDGYLNRSGNIINSPNWYHSSKYIPVNSGSTYTITKNYGGGVASYCLYNSNKILISCTEYGSYNELPNIIPSQDGFIRYTLRTDGNFYTRFSGLSCTNGNQALDDSINDLNDSLNDETVPNLDLSDLEVSSDTPISDLITMPLTILNTLIQTLDGSCTNYTIPFFYNNSLTFPCFTISDYLGNTVTNYIDLFICFYMCYNIAMLVVSVFEDITSLRDIYDSMYVPKHADMGYQPKHAKGGGN